MKLNVSRICRLLTGLALLFASFEGIAAAQTCTPPPSGLVGWWSGDGHANDIAGNNNGTIVGNVGFAAGEVAQAFSFPNAGSFAEYVDVGNAPSLQVSSGDFTVDAWIYPTAICDEFPGAGCSSRGIIGKMATAPNLDGWRFFLEGPKLTFNAGGQTFNTGTHAELPNFSVSVGSWSFVAVVKRGTNIELYKNPGALFSSTPINVFYDSNSAPMWIGSDPSEGNTFSGLIDEVEVFNRALSADELRAIYSAGSAGKCKFLSISIEIKPPAAAPVPMNLRSAGVVPVAILSTTTFDATQVDPATVTLAAAEVQMIGKSDKYSCSAEDVNADGLNDLVCQVSTAQFLIQPGQSTAVLHAKTISGQEIQGQETITIVRR
jgi:hypothetical protein